MLPAEQGLGTHKSLNLIQPQLFASIDDNRYILTEEEKLLFLKKMKMAQGLFLVVSLYTFLPCFCA